MPSRLPAIIVGGVCMGVLISLVRFIPLLGECLACLALAGAGVLAVWKYTTDHQVTISGGSGAGMGAAAAVVAGVTDALIGLLLSVMGMAVGIGAMRAQMVEALEGSGYDPETLDMMEQIFESSWFIPVVLACSFVLYMLVGAVGGAIGAASFKKGTDFSHPADTAPEGTV